MSWAWVDSSHILSSLNSGFRSDQQLQNCSCCDFINPNMNPTSQQSLVHIPQSQLYFFTGFRCRKLPFCDPDKLRMKTLVFAQQKVHREIDVIHPWPPGVTVRPFISLHLSVILLGSTDWLEWEAATDPASLSLRTRNMAYLLFVSGKRLFWKCAVATGHRSSSISEALSLSLRYICTINKGEGLRPSSCFDFVIYIWFILYPHTHNHFLLEWQDHCG